MIEFIAGFAVGISLCVGAAYAFWRLALDTVDQ